MMDLAIDNMVDFRSAAKPTQLELRYRNLYGKEFVEDMKAAYRWMRQDMHTQPPLKEVAKARRADPSDINQFFFVDFYREELWLQLVSKHGKTIQSLDNSAILDAEKASNLQLLLSGLYALSPEKANRWREELLPKGQKIRIGLIRP